MAKIYLENINGQSPPFELDLDLVDASVRQDFIDFLDSFIVPQAAGCAVTCIKYAND